jgi:hypothetical protein
MLDASVSQAYWGLGITYYRLGNYVQSLADYRTYERLTGTLEPEMQAEIAEMEAALTSTPAATSTLTP